MKKIQKTKGFKFFLSVFFALALVFAGSYLVVKSSFLPDFGKPAGVVAKAGEEPKELFIPKISKALDISDGVYKNGHWEVSKTGVSYLTGSGSVGKQGNAVLYGHDLPSILGHLTEVKNGDLVYVVTNSGKFYKYRVFATKTISPSQVEILENTNDARITVYTCSGFLDSARFVVMAELVN